MTPTPQAAGRRYIASPLWGLWLALLATVAGCVQGVAAGQIPFLRALLAVICLAAVIKLAAQALDIPAHPVASPGMVAALRRLRLVRRAPVRALTAS